MLDILLSWARKKAFYHVYHLKYLQKIHLKMPSAYVVCCIFLLILHVYELFKCMGKQCGHRSDCSYMSSLVRVYIVCRKGF